MCSQVFQYSIGKALWTWMPGDYLTGDGQFCDSFGFEEQVSLDRERLYVGR